MFAVFANILKIQNTVFREVKSLRKQIGKFYDIGESNKTFLLANCRLFLYKLIDVLLEYSPE